MPRLARYIENDGYYHVISRSINEEWIIKDRGDFNYFLELEYLAKKKFPLRLFHYVIMNTHFHYVLQAISKELLSRHMAFIKLRYTRYARGRYGWKGPLWRERYRSLPIQNAAYLTACGTYVEYNPVRAEICMNPSDYPYSSNRKYQLGAADRLVDEYEIDSSLQEVVVRDVKGHGAKEVFSDSRAIGDPFYVASCQQRGEGTVPKGDSPNLGLSPFGTVPL